MNDEQGLELLIGQEFLDQGHYPPVRLERISCGEAQHLEAHTPFEPGRFGERADRQPAEDRIRLLDEVL